MISAVHEKFSHLSTKVTPEKSKNTVKPKDTEIAEELKMLHCQTAAVPIHKARGNLAFVCWRHYAQVLINELALINVNSTTSTHIKATKPVDKNASDITSFLKEKYNLEVTSINKKPPNIYWTPKLHKNSTKAKFITSPTKCSVKPLSKAVTAALKLI